MTDTIKRKGAGGYGLEHSDKIRMLMISFPFHIRNQKPVTGSHKVSHV